MEKCDVMGTCCFMSVAAGRAEVAVSDLCERAVGQVVMQMSAAVREGQGPSRRGEQKVEEKQ